MTELNSALAAFNAGHLDEARRLLVRLLQKSNGNVDALYLLAVTEQASKNHETSLALYEQVLATKPKHEWAHYNKALLLSGMGRHSDALPSHDRAVQLAPTNFWAYINRGNSRAALRRFDEAIGDYDQALKIKPGLPNALANKGNALFEQGRLPEALTCLDQAVQLHPQHAEAWISRSQVLTKMGQPHAGVACAQQALKLQPTHPEAWIRKGAALLDLEKYEDALADIEKAISVCPNHPAAWSARGDALAKLDRLAEALGCYDKSIAIAPTVVQSHINKALALQYQGQYEQAQSCYEQAVKLEPDHGDANRNYSLLLLGQHDYVLGWERYEYRWRSSAEGAAKRLVTSRPLWTGPESALPLLLWGEQGIGDQILYGSILPELSTSPLRKLVALDKRLLALFERSVPGFEYFDLAQTSDALGFGSQLPLGSLPRHFRTSVESFSGARYPYLMADPTRSAILRQKVVRTGKRVCGVSWTSSRKDIGSKKSINLEQLLIPLASGSTHFVNLQYGDTATEREALQLHHGIDVQNVNEVDNFNDIDGLAALIEACDVVITTSNTTAHLAGALGKETLLLLPLGKGKLWYWSEHEGKNLWYPSVRIFVQDQPGHWQEALARIKAHLESRP